MENVLEVAMIFTSKELGIFYSEKNLLEETQQLLIFQSRYSLKHQRAKYSRGRVLWYLVNTKNEIVDHF